MAGRRKRQPPPPAPTLGAVAIDGGNVIASAPGRAVARLGPAVRWIRATWPDLEVWLFLDATTARRCEALAPGALDRWLAGLGPSAPRLVRCPEGSPADVPLLRFARERQALVLSNDRFFAHEELRRNVLTLQFTLARGTFTAAAEATWFRSPGHAVRVPVGALRRYWLPM